MQDSQRQFRPECRVILRGLLPLIPVSRIKVPVIDYELASHIVVGWGICKTSRSNQALNRIASPDPPLRVLQRQERQ